MKNLSTEELDNYRRNCRCRSVFQSYGHRIPDTVYQVICPLQQKLT